MEFIDLKAQYRLIEQNVRDRINGVLEHGNYILGPEVVELEKRLAEFAGVKHCISCASGTDALLMALMAKGIGPGDAVFTTTFTFIATAEVIALLGATPVFVDIDTETFNIDVDKLEETIDTVQRGKKCAAGMPDKLRPAAIIPVDIFGVPADYDRINVVARKHGLFVLEDAAQSFGARYKGKPAGSLADVAATSFFPAKPLGCYGDGGAIFTDDSSLAAILKSIRVHGKGSDKYDNVRIGINGRLDTLQAAVLLAKMEIFAKELELRQNVADRYATAFQNRFQLQKIPRDSVSAWAQFTLLSADRDRMINHLETAGVPTAVYYPKPLHLQTAFGYLGYKPGDMQVAEKISQQCLSLPMYPYLDEETQNKVVKHCLQII